MKTKLQSIRKALFLIIMCLPFVSCSDDTPENSQQGIIDLKNLEGTWGLTRSTGIVHTNNYTWDTEYNPYDPAGQCTIWKIKKSDSNLYHIAVTESFDYGNWHNEYELETRLEDNVLIGTEYPEIKFFFQTLTEDQMITYQYDTDTEGKNRITYEENKTFIKMK